MILGWLEDNVVQFVVTVDNSRAGLRLTWEVLGVPIHEVVESGYPPDGYPALKRTKGLKIEFLKREKAVRRVYGQQRANWFSGFR